MPEITNKQQTMKKIFITLMLFCSFAMQSTAQEIYEEVKNILVSYETEKNDTLKNIELRKIATFKYDAIYYMLLKTEGETERELGNQVASMIDFVNLFLERVNETRKDKNKKELVVSKFKAASLEHAKYNDTDKETVYAYVDHPNFLTQFSLDTDWVKALEAVQQ